MAAYRHDLNTSQEMVGGTSIHGRPRQRASQACLPVGPLVPEHPNQPIPLPFERTEADIQCHRRKLRCSGDWPCKRCHTAGAACEYAAGRPVPPLASSVAATQDRMQQLEHTVSSLVSALTSTSTAPGTGPPMVSEPQSSQRAPLVSPDPTHAAPGSMPRAIGSDTVFISHLSPHLLTSPESLSSHRHPIDPLVVSPSSSAALTLGTTKRPGKHEKAEERLELATKGSFEPPFRPLTYAPAIWENKEASRMASPEHETQPRVHPHTTGDHAGQYHPSPTHASVYDQPYGHRRDDPVNTGIITPALAETLCVVVVAARYYNGYNARAHTHAHAGLGLADSPIEAGTQRRLVNLAFSHLGQTLLSKRHTLEDVQANLLVAAWSIVGEGGGSDAWVTTGHALRLLRRLGIHRQLRDVGAVVDREEAEVESFLPQWRTWLAWVGFDTFFSLGYGRPASAHFDAVDADALMRVHLRRPIPRPGSAEAKSRAGDIYLVSQVQLVQIGRDVRAWVQALQEGDGSCSASGSGSAKLEEMQAFNARLDGWCQTWIWPGSSRRVQLAASATVAALQADHVRLCINSYALQMIPTPAEAVPLLRQAYDAAVSVISTHELSSQGDLALSFAIDYHTITVAQAALFLIRLCKATSPAGSSSNSSSGLDPDPHPVPIAFSPDTMTHYVDAAVVLLETGDLSEIRFASFLARTVSGIAQAAGLVLASSSMIEPSGSGSRARSRLPTGLRDSTMDPSGPSASDGHEHAHVLYEHSTGFGDINPGWDAWMPPFGTDHENASGEFMGLGLGGGFDLDAFLQFGGDDLNALLALPLGDGDGDGDGFGR